MAKREGQGTKLQSLEVKHNAIRGLLDAHKIDNTVCISNGLLMLVEDDKALFALLSDEEKEFLEKSRKEFDESLQLEYDANQEYTTALAEADARTRELEAAKLESENLRIKAEALAKAASTERDVIAAELEGRAKYDLQNKRQEFQFNNFAGIIKPMWILTFSILGIIAFLGYFEIESQALVTIFSVCVTAATGISATATASLYNNMYKDDKPDTKSSGKRKGCDE